MILFSKQEDVQEKVQRMNILLILWENLVIPLSSPADEWVSLYMFEEIW